MKIIAFKRAGNDHKSLHPDFITEYVDSSLIESTQGYETLPEEFFLKELAKNDQRHSDHLKYLDLLDKSTKLAESMAANAQMAEEKVLQREFEQFKRWKLNQKRK